MTRFPYTYVAAFAATVPLANWMIAHVGIVCPPDSPCLVPVGFGLMAPSGVLAIGIALVLRDLVHESGGYHAALIAIAIGALLSFFVSPPALVIASVAAFLFSELADLAVYTPLRERSLGLAVLLSGLAGSIVDSVIFLGLAFGSMEFLVGQILGKVIMSLLAAIVLFGLRLQGARR